MNRRAVIDPNAPVVIGQSAQRPTHSGLRGPAFAPWQPFQPNLTPPTGFYDPTLDANLGSANRGLFDLTQDIETQKGRLTTDYGTGVANINRGADRSLEDIGTQRAYGTADHTTQLAELQRAYDRRATMQKQQQNSMGVLQGGAALQAAQKRAANQTHDQAPIDENFKRLMAGLDTSQGRVTQDRDLGLADLSLNYAPPDASNPFGGRAFQDLATQLARGNREGAAFTLDTEAAKAAQASAAGWNPYAQRPGNQHGAGAKATKTVTKGGIVYTIDPKGRIISKRKAGS